MKPPLFKRSFITFKLNKPNSYYARVMMLCFLACFINENNRWSKTQNIGNLKMETTSFKCFFLSYMQYMLIENTHKRRHKSPMKSSVTENRKGDLFG